MPPRPRRPKAGRTRMLKPQIRYLCDRWWWWWLIWVGGLGDADAIGRWLVRRGGGRSIRGWVGGWMGWVGPTGRDGRSDERLWGDHGRIHAPTDPNPYHSTVLHHHRHAHAAPVCICYPPPMLQCVSKTHAPREVVDVGQVEEVVELGREEGLLERRCLWRLAAAVAALAAIPTPVPVAARSARCGCAQHW